MDNIRHSVVVVTYNQENFISETLDSILSQSVMPYELIVCDDCSTDGTMAVVKTYVDKYPEIVRCVRNEKNLGVFGNLNNSTKYVTGDFVNYVAGDDLLPAGILEAYSTFIKEQSLSCKDRFLIFTDSETLHKDGKITRFCNDVVLRRGIMDATVMCELQFWETGMSRGLFDCLPKYRTDIGYQADWLFHIERIAEIDKYYYLPVSGYVYRKDVGVTNASKLKILRQSRLEVINILRMSGIPLSERSQRFINLIGETIKHLDRPTIRSYFSMVKCRVKLGKTEKGNEFHHNWRIFIPRCLVNMLRRVCPKPKSV